MWRGIAVAALTGVAILLQFREARTQSGIFSRQLQQAESDSTANARRMRRQLRIAENQAKSAQDSVDAINRQMLQEERAWVVGQAGLPEAEITNIGKTPAFEVSNQTFIHINNGGPIPDIAKWMTSQKDPFKLRESKQSGRLSIGVLFPGQHIGAYSDLQMPPPNSDPEILNGHRILYLIGQIDYVTFNVHHVTRFCGMWVPKGKGFDPGYGCRTWNYAD
jgi:hypothetical protein